MVYKIKHAGELIQMVLQEYTDFRTLKRERVAISSREPCAFLCTHPAQISAGSCFTVGNSLLWPSYTEKRVYVFVLGEFLCMN